MFIGKNLLILRQRIVANYRTDAGDDKCAENRHRFYQPVFRQRRAAEGFSDI